MKLRSQGPPIVVLAAVLVVAVAAVASAFSLWPYDLPRQPQPYVVEGYLDRAPEGTKILDDVPIVVDRHERTLLITSYGYGQIDLDLHLSRPMAHKYEIRGPDEAVAQLASAKPGTRIAGTFSAYTDGPPWLLISDLSFPTDDDKPGSKS